MLSSLNVFFPPSDFSYPDPCVHKLSIKWYSMNVYKLETHICICTLLFLGAPTKRTLGFCWFTFLIVWLYGAIQITANLRGTVGFSQIHALNP